MKSIFSASLFTAALLFSTTSAHSWLECCRDEPKNYDSVKADPSLPLYVIPLYYPAVYSLSSLFQKSLVADCPPPTVRPNAMAILVTR